MHWVLLSLLSALILGFYAVAKKSAVHKNAVPPVLLLNVLTAAVIYLPVIVISRISPDSLSQTLLFVEPMSLFILGHGKPKLDQVHSTAN